MPERKLEVVNLSLNDLIPYARNARTHSPEQVSQVAASIKEFGWTNPVLIDEDGGIIAGHGRVKAAEKLGLDEVPTITLAGLSEAQKRAYVLADNKLALNAGWDEEMLAVELADLKELDFDLELTGFTEDEFASLAGDDGAGYGPAGKSSGKMSEDFGAPPFTVFDARQGSWQERKRQWIDLGIKSEEGRGNNLLDYGKGVSIGGGKDTSIFDPVLCELIYSWFSPKGGACY
jgi:hypothetical protein